METSRAQLVDFPLLQVSTAAAWLPTPGRTAAKLLDRWGDQGRGRASLEDSVSLLLPPNPSLPAPHPLLTSPELWAPMSPSIPQLFLPHGPQGHVLTTSPDS